MVDYLAVIADLELKRKVLNARFDAAIAAIRQVLAMDEMQPMIPGLADARPVRKHLSYKGLSMVDAAKAHLLTISGPVPNVELARALEHGGFQHKSKSFPNTLNSVLRRRMMAVGDLKKDPKGWMLSANRRAIRLDEVAGVDEP